MIGRPDKLESFGSAPEPAPSCPLPPPPSRFDRRHFLFWAAGTSLGATSFFLLATLAQALMPPARSIEGMTKVGRLEVARLSDLEIGSPVLAEYGDEKILVVKTSHDAARAFDAACPHARCTLRYNAEAARFDCPCHRSSFTVDGRKIAGPAPRDMVRAAVEIVDDAVVVTGFLA